jgi:hypothetical protein
MSNDAAAKGTPRWVKIFVLVVAALFVAFAILHITGNSLGDHGP